MDYEINRKLKTKAYGKVTFAPIDTIEKITIKAGDTFSGVDKV